MTQADARTSLSCLETDRIQLQPSDAIAIGIVDGHTRVGHAFYYLEEMKEARGVLESGAKVQIGLIHSGDNHDVAGLCIVTDEESQSETGDRIILGEGSSRVMRHILRTMIPTWRLSGMRDIPLEEDVMFYLADFEASNVACKVGDVITFVHDVDNQSAGVVFDVISSETGRSVGPVLLRNSMIHALLDDFDMTGEENVDIGFGFVRPEDPGEVTLYVLDPYYRASFRAERWGRPTPTGVAVGSAQVIHRLLCNLSPTWNEQIAFQDHDLAVFEEVWGGTSRMWGVSYEEARQLVERLMEICLKEGIPEILPSP